MDEENDSPIEDALESVNTSKSLEMLEKTCEEEFIKKGVEIPDFVVDEAVMLEE